MKYVKTYEQLKPFYKGGDEYLILNEDETLVALKMPDVSALLLFDISILDEFINTFLISSHDYANTSVNFYNRQIADYRVRKEAGMDSEMPPIFKMDDTVEGVSNVKGELHRGIKGFTRWWEVLSNASIDRVTAMGPKVEVDLKLVKMHSGVMQPRKINFG